MVWVRKLKHYAITNIIADILIVAPLVYIMSYEVNIMKVCVPPAAPISSARNNLQLSLSGLFGRIFRALFFFISKEN
jgi:hypothetical protein